MNLVQQSELFYDMYVTDGDVFAGINNWVNDASKRYSNSCGRLSKSEALTSCITGEFPEDLDKRRIVVAAEIEYIDKYIHEALSQIDDVDVRQSVEKSLYESRQEKNLTFMYLSNLTRAQRARVRVICKLVWYNLYPKEATHGSSQES